MSKLEGFKKQILLENLREDELARIAEISEVVHFSKNESIFKESGLTTGIYMINSGEVEITKRLPIDIKTKVLVTLRNVQNCCEIRKTPVGWKQVFATLIEGQFFGELSVVERRERHGAEADVTEDSELFHIKKEDFFTLETTHPQIISKMMKTIAKISSKNVRQLDRKLLKLLIGY